MTIGVLHIEVHLPRSHSLKDKRAVIKSLKDQIRGRFNVAVAELESNEKWQRAALGISTLGEERAYVEGLLKEVVGWLRITRLVDLIRIDEEYL